MGSPGQRAGNAMISDYSRHDRSINKVMPNSRENDTAVYGGSGAVAGAMPVYSSMPGAADQANYQSMQFE